MVDKKFEVSEWLKKDKPILKEFQSVLGKLNFVAHCVKPARIFICRLLNWLRNIQDTSTPQPLPEEPKNNIMAFP